MLLGAGKPKVGQLFLVSDHALDGTPGFSAGRSVCYPGSAGGGDKDGDSSAGTLPSPEPAAPQVGTYRCHLTQRPALSTNANSLYLKELGEGNKETNDIKATTGT